VVVGEYARPALSNLHSAALVPDAAAVDANASQHLRSSSSSSIDRERTIHPFR
jgi:hypothetical protein